MRITSITGFLFRQRFPMIIIFFLITAYLAAQNYLIKTRSPDFSVIQGDVERGARIIHLAGCISCHTKAESGDLFLAGGRQLETPFGTFTSPNITPDRETGIGDWTLREFWNALVNGKAPDGRKYYPVFPYTSYTKMTEQDIVDLKVYLDTLPPVQNRVDDHDLPFPFSIRSGLLLWRFLFFVPGQMVADPTQSDDWNRGRYIVNGPGHCGECHTSRNFLGGLSSELLAGGAVGMSGDPVPPIRGSANTELSNWSIDDIMFALQTGIKPDGDVFGSEMADVVEYATGHLSDEDLLAIAVYLKSK